jgi:CBS domain-containing protein
MTTEVLTTSAERPVAEVTGMMVKARVGSAVVLQGSWLAGILTERDVLRAAASGSDLTPGSAVGGHTGVVVGRMLQVSGVRTAGSSSTTTEV